MAQIGTEITITDIHYRPCIVNGKKALFHRYEEYKNIVDINTSKLIAIVEKEDRTSNES